METYTFGQQKQTQNLGEKVLNNCPYFSFFGDKRQTNLTKGQSLKTFLKFNQLNINILVEYFHFNVILCTVKSVCIDMFLHY